MGQLLILVGLAGGRGGDSFPSAGVVERKAVLERHKEGTVGLSSPPFSKRDRPRSVKYHTKCKVVDRGRGEGKRRARGRGGGGGGSFGHRNLKHSLNIP